MGIDVICGSPSLIPGQNASQSVKPGNQRPLSGTNKSKRPAPPQMHPGCETWSMKKMKRREQHASRIHHACVRRYDTFGSENRGALPLGAPLPLCRVLVQPLDKPLLVLVGQVRHAVVQEIKTAPRCYTTKACQQPGSRRGSKKGDEPLLTSISPNINPHLQFQQRSSHAGAVVAVELALDVEHAPPQPGVVQVLAGGRVEVPGARGGGCLARRRVGVDRDDGVANALLVGAR